jgi:hypothetical protein
MAASRLDFVLPAFLVSFGLAVAGVLVLVFRRSVPACCPSPLDWVALAVGVLGLSGAASFGTSAANRFGKRRVAARFRSLATKLPAAPPMWMALFTEVEAGSGVAVSLPYAALWRTRPVQVAELPPPRDLRHVPAVCVQLYVQHGYSWVTSRCPASGWSEPELVAVLGEPSPDHWIVIRRWNGEVLWPARRATSGHGWLTEYRRHYKKIRRRRKRAERHASPTR